MVGKVLLVVSSSEVLISLKFQNQGGTPVFLYTRAVIHRRVNLRVSSKELWQPLRTCCPSQAKQQLYVDAQAQRQAPKAQTKRNETDMYSITKQWTNDTGHERYSRW